MIKELVVSGTNKNDSSNDQLQQQLLLDGSWLIEPCNIQILVAAVISTSNGYTNNCHHDKFSFVSTPTTVTSTSAATAIAIATAVTTKATTATATSASMISCADRGSHL